VTKPGADGSEHLAGSLQGLRQGFLDIRPRTGKLYIHVADAVARRITAAESASPGGIHCVERRREYVVNDENEIRNLVDTWLAATKAGDSGTVLGLMTDDAVFLVAGQAPFGKSAFAGASEAQSAAPVEFDGRSETLEVKVLGDWAYAITKLRVTVTRVGSEPMVRAGHTLTVLRKEAGRWKIARDANLLVPVDAACEGAA